MILVNHLTDFEATHPGTINHRGYPWSKGSFYPFISKHRRMSYLISVHIFTGSDTE